MTSTLKKKERTFWFAILLLLFPLSAFAQVVSVSGTIKDEFGDGLVGVTVMEEGTTNGVISDVNGNYRISVSSQAKLNFSYIGYRTQSIEVRDRSVIDITMREDNEMLSEVVVVGYGQMKRSDLTGAITSVSSDAISKSVPTSIDQVLQGRAAGVQVTQNTGLPGGNTSIRIRGISSLQASNEPIFVIDGVVIDGKTDSSSENALASINPADVVSMDILKDASATAIYGSRGANGVIIITTNKGREGAARITYDGYVGMQTMPKKLDLLNLREFAYHKNERCEIMGYPMDDSFVRPDLLGEGTDWQDELFGTAMTTNHNLTISGGTAKALYSIGAGYLDQEGIALGSGFKRFSLRGNVDAEVKSWLKAGVNFNIVNSKQEITVTDNDIIYTALTQTPNVAAKNIDGSFGGPETDEFVQTNPVGLALLKENENERLSARSNIYLDFIFHKTLNLKTEFSSDFGINNDYRFTPSYSFGAIVNDVRESTRAKSYSKYWAWRNILTYNNTFAEKHTVNAMLGYEMQESSWEYLAGYRRGFITNNAHNLNAGDSSTSTNTGSSGGNSLISTFGRLFYSFDERYLLTTTLRYDGSSKFAEGNRWSLFPSVAVAWRISGEEFMKDVESVSNLKVRFGWGKVGNQNLPDDYAHTSTMAAVATPWGTGLLSGNTAYPDLEWETTSSSNIGFDAGFFNNRLAIVFDAYYKKTDNLLFQLSLPAYVGTAGQGSTTPPWVNIGSLENKGIEISLNTVNIEKRDFRWTSNFVYSMNRNKVKKLDTESSILDMTMSKGSETSIITRTAVGEPIGQFYGYKVIGRFETATDFYYKDENGEVKETPRPEGQPISQNGVWIGDYIFEDVNKDGVINDADRTYIGNPEPKFTFGIGNNFSYKEWDLSFSLSGSYGNDIYNWIRRWTDDPRQSHNLNHRATEFARLGYIDSSLPGGSEQGQLDNIRNITIVDGSSSMPRLSSADANSNYRVSDRFVEDGSYLRIQNISLGYTFPKHWLKKIMIENLRIYANLQNVYTFTKYKGYDPEIGSMNQSALLTGIDNARYPSPKIYTIGLNVTF